MGRRDREQHSTAKLPWRGPRRLHQFSPADPPPHGEPLPARSLEEPLVERDDLERGPCPSAATMAAASWRAGERQQREGGGRATSNGRLVARPGPAAPRPSCRRVRRASAASVASPVMVPSRSNLAIAETHSIAVAHHTSIAGSSCASACIGTIVSSPTSNRDDRRAVPEPQRPERLFSSSACTALAPRRALGGSVDRSSLAAGFLAGRTTPARSRRATRPSVSDRIVAGDSNRATGIPRSTINTVSPPRT